jgi:hypothetical protein
MEIHIQVWFIYFLKVFFAIFTGPCCWPWCSFISHAKLIIAFAVYLLLYIQINYDYLSIKTLRNTSAFTVSNFCSFFKIREKEWIKQEVRGRTNRLLSLIRHGPYWRRVQQFFYCCVCIRYRGNVPIEPLPSNDKGIHIQTHRLMGEIF